MLLKRVHVWHFLWRTGKGAQVVLFHVWRFLGSLVKQGRKIWKSALDWTGSSLTTRGAAVFHCCKDFTRLLCWLYMHLTYVLLYLSPSSNIQTEPGDLIEKGVMRRLPEGFDGNTCPYIFTWSEKRPCTTWGMGSGCAPFYNTCKEGTANTRMVRYFDEDRFEIFANRDIEKDEELLHTYISLKWRGCFSELNEIVHADEKTDEKKESS